MNKLYALCSFAFLTVALTACGSELEQGCQGQDCTEAEINAPVGEQPKEVIVPYGELATDPARESLRFPTFNPSWGLKRSIYAKAVAYYEANRTSIPNPRYASLIDFSLHSSKKRLFLFDLSNGQVEKHNVSHGKNSDPDGDGMATQFSNTEGSLMSSLGIYHTYETYNGKYGYSLRLLGLEESNSNAYARAIVMHSATYVNNAAGKAGRSWGCPAVDPKVSKGMINKIKNGSLLLIGR